MNHRNKKPVYEFKVLSPEQADQRKNDPLRKLEPHQLILLKKVIFPTIEQILSSRGSESTIFIGDQDFDLPITYDGINPIITPDMLEAVRRHYSGVKNDREINFPKNPAEKNQRWDVTIYNHETVIINGVAKTCCLEFR